MQESSDFMEEDHNSLVESMLCDPNTRLIPSGFTIPYCTDEYVMFVNAGDESSFLRMRQDREESSHSNEHARRMQFLKDIVPAAQNNINSKFILLDKGRIAMEGQNKTCLALVADETAAVHFQLWGDECDAFESGDIIHLVDGIFSYNHSRSLVLRAGRRGKIEKVGEFTMVFVETPNMSEIHWVHDPNNPKIYVQESVISLHSRIFTPML